MTAYYALLSMPFIMGMVFTQTENDSQVSDVYKVECRKPRNTSGCTAHNSKSYSAPTGHVIDDKSVRVQIKDGWNRGKRMDCTPELKDMRNVSTTLPNGRTLNITAPTTLIVTAHSESGSGPSNMGRTSFVECEISFTTYDPD